MSLHIVRRSLRSVILLRLRGLRSAALRFRRSWRSGTRYLVSFPSLLRHREGNIQVRPAARRASAFPDSSPKASVGPLPKKQPWALGSSPPLRPFRLSAPSRSGERKRRIQSYVPEQNFAYGLYRQGRGSAPPPTRRPTLSSRSPPRIPTRTRSLASTSRTPSGTASWCGESSASSPTR